MAFARQQKISVTRRHSRRVIAVVELSRLAGIPPARCLSAVAAVFSPATFAGLPARSPSSPGDVFAFSQLKSFHSIPRRPIGHPVPARCSIAQKGRYLPL
jgi:hypothetical protein